MSEDRYRRLFRAGLAPLVDDVPKGPEWDELNADDIVTAAPVPKRASRRLVGLAVSAVAVLVVGVAVVLAPAEPPPSSGSGEDVPPAIPEFDEEAASTHVEEWWSHVIDNEFSAATGMAHPDAIFNFGPLLRSLTGLGRNFEVSAGGEVFGTDQQPMLCYTLSGTGGTETGAAVFRFYDGQWMLWEIRPGIVGCLDDAPTTTSLPTSTVPISSGSRYGRFRSGPVIFRVSRS